MKRMHRLLLLFQFPTNGKAHSDLFSPIAHLGSRIARVSIPYEREGTFRRLNNPLDCRLRFREFQFPTNGKAHSDRGKRSPIGARSKFQFPTNGKAHSDSTPASSADRAYDPGFNSLRTGRHIQTYPIFDPDKPWLRTP